MTAMSVDHMTLVGQRMTADEFLALGEGYPRAQLIDGEVVLNQPQPPHQHICIDLLFALKSWTREAPQRGLVILPLDVRLDDRSVYAPDMLWYAEGRGPGRRASAPSPMPGIAVEVRSPSTWAYDIGVERATYERHGLAELWLVDTRAHAVRIFRRSAPDAPSFDIALELERDGQLASPQLPGFALALDELFAEV
jgi:Uma2 family endonuclease